MCYSPCVWNKVVKDGDDDDDDDHDDDHDDDDHRVVTNRCPCLPPQLTAAVRPTPKDPSNTHFVLQHLKMPRALRMTTYGSTNREPSDQ